MPPSPKPPRPKKPTGRTTKTGRDRNGTTMSVTSNNGKPESFTEWETLTGKVKRRGKFPL